MQQACARAAARSGRHGRGGTVGSSAVGGGTVGGADQKEGVAHVEVVETRRDLASAYAEWCRRVAPDVEQHDATQRRQRLHLHVVRLVGRHRPVGSRCRAAVLVASVTHDDRAASLCTLCHTAGLSGGAFSAAVCHHIQRHVRRLRGRDRWRRQLVLLLCGSRRERMRAREHDHPFHQGDEALRLLTLRDRLRHRRRRHLLQQSRQLEAPRQKVERRDVGALP